MSEFRRNPITGQWVIIAANRGSRPQEIVVEHVPSSSRECPFCEGRESITPGEVLTIREPGSSTNGPCWRVRVVPNKYPALDATMPGRSSNAHAVGADEGWHADVALGDGLHEVVIESPSHLTSVVQLSDTQFADVLEVYRLRIHALQRHGVFRRAVLFKNAGPSARATLTHLHSQIIATKAGDSIFQDRTPYFRLQSESHGGCPACEIDRGLLAKPDLLLARSKNFVAFCPFASRFPYETWIIPRQHRSHFGEIAPDHLGELAALFRGVLVKLERIVKLPAYNYIIHTAPFDTAAPDHYHWHIEILPRIANLAGFELATGCFINTVPPDRAATALREA
jgi:UDPglucose--hexose-1-phosphate uridylyltransferase